MKYEGKVQIDPPPPQEKLPSKSPALLGAKLLGLINEQDDNDDVIDKMYLHAKDLSEPKYDFLIKKREVAGLKLLDNPNANAFIECSNTMIKFRRKLMITTKRRH